MSEGYTTKSMPFASMLAYLFPDRFLGAEKNGNHCFFIFEPSDKKDEFTYEQIYERLYSKESIIVGNALEFIIACATVKRAVNMAHKGEYIK